MGSGEKRKKSGVLNAFPQTDLEGINDVSFSGFQHGSEDFHKPGGGGGAGEHQLQVVNLIKNLCCLTTDYPSGASLRVSRIG